MEARLGLPQQHGTVPILAASILLGLLLSPALERALESWMPGAAGSTASGGHGGPSPDPGQGSTWELRSM